MKLLIRLVAVLAALSVFFTVWFIAAFAAVGALQAVVTSGSLGVLTLVGWAITLAAGPLAAVQLWRFRESGRRAGIILFGYGFAYYLIGALWLRAPEASLWQIFVAATVFALPLVVLVSPRARTLCAAARPGGAG